MGTEPQVPHTEAEIAAAKAGLRKEFLHAAEHLDRYFSSTDFVEGRNLAVRARHISEEQYDAEVTEARKAIEKAAAEVVAGTAEGEKILDRFIASWQIEGRLPKFIVGG
jgi:hypothetical protein